MEQPPRNTLDEQLAAIAALPGSGATPLEFLQRLLEAVAEPTAVHGAGIWVGQTAQTLDCRAAEGAEYREWIANGGVSAGFTASRLESLATVQRRLIPYESLDAEPHAPSGLAGSTLVHWPLRSAAGGSLLELVFDGSADESVRRNVLERLQRAEPHCAAFLDGIDTAAPAPSAATGGDWEQFLIDLHRTLHLNEVSFTIANDGRRLIGCDRVCVLIDDGARLRLASISGVDVPDRRSTAVRSIEAAGAAAARAGIPLTYSEAHASSELPSEPIAEYVDASEVRTAVLRPLIPQDESQPQRAVGVLIAEWFTQVNPDRYEPQLDRLARHATLAVSNALQHADIAWAQSLLPVHWVRRLWLGGRGPWTAAALFAALVLVAVLTFVPATLTVSAHGELQPVVRQHIYAPLDGVVEQVRVDADDDVAANATLLTMTNPALDLEVQRVAGAIDTWTKKLASIGIQRLDDGGRREDTGAAERMSGEEAEIREELTSLRQQLALLEKKRAMLTVTTPIAGRVVTWNLRDDLSQRPVSEGERLLTVADLHSGWELELRLDERDAGHVVDALSAATDGLDVEFLLASRADQTHHARLERVANAVYWDRDSPGERVSAPATAVVTSDSFEGERPGTTVGARINCGRRSLGYVWFHDLYEAIVRFVWY